MFRNDDEKNDESIEEDELIKRAAAVREGVLKTISETKEKLDSLVRQDKSTVATSSQSGLFSSTANKANETVEESRKPKKGNGGCNIL